MGGFWGLCFYLRFFTYNPYAEDVLTYALIALGIIFFGALWIKFKHFSAPTEKKVHLITPEQRTIEQERVLKAEAARLKVRDDAKKAEREKLARLLDEL